MVEFYEGGDMENIPDDWGYDENYDWEPTNEEYDGPIETTWNSDPYLTKESPGAEGGVGQTKFYEPSRGSDKMPRYIGLSPSKPFGMSGGGGGYRPNTQEETGAAKIAARTAQANLDEQIRQYNTEQNARRTSAIQGGEGLVNLVNEYNRSYAQARYDYEQRYNQMLGIADSTTSQQQADVRAQYAGQRSTGMQKLQRLGMANTSLTSSMQQGLQRGESDSLNRLADTMQQTKLGIIGSKKTAQELAPSRDMILAALAQAQGASGSFGGQLTKALGALDQGLSPLPYDPNAGTQIGPALTDEGITKAVNLSIGSNW